MNGFMEKKMTLGNILRRKSSGVVTIDICWSLQSAAAIMTRHHIAALIVTDHGKPVGLISERDLVCALAKTGSHASRTSIREVTTGPAIAISAEESIMNAMMLMAEKRVRYLPVFDNGELIGLVTLPDLIRYRLQEIELEAMSYTTRRPRVGRDDAFFVSDEFGLLSRNRDAA